MAEAAETVVVAVENLIVNIYQIQKPQLEEANKANKQKFYLKPL
jgi:hypothetical protein